MEIILESDTEPVEEIKIERRGMFMSAFGSFLLTVLAAVPAVLCLLIVQDLHTALMYAGVVSSVCMFFIGYYMGPYLGTKGWISGFSVLAMALGITLVASFTGG